MLKSASVTVSTLLICLGCGQPAQNGLQTTAVGNETGGESNGSTGGGNGSSGTGGATGGTTSSAGDAGTSGGGAPGGTAGTSGQGGSNSETCLATCRADQVCSLGQCSCPLPSEECEGVCVDTSSDPANCGECGTPCETDLVCDNGECATGCASDKVNCDGACIDPATNTTFCGASDDCFAATRGEQCRLDQVCDGGQCRCAAGFQECGDTCVGILNNPLHCGGCNAVCGQAENTESTCSQGACTCSTGWENCDEAPDCETEAGYSCGTCIDCERIMFVTEPRYTGNLGGLAGADAACQELAELGGLEDYIFVAWLSSSSESASDRLVHGTNKYDSLGDIADDWDDLTDGELSNAFTWRGETNVQAGPLTRVVWTGTDAAGEAVPGESNCDDWTSDSASDVGAVGNLLNRDSYWSYDNSPEHPNNGLDPCSEMRSLICVFNGVPLP